MYCTRCGNAMDEAAAFCPHCGLPVVPVGPVGGAIPPPTIPAEPIAVTYAGFWLRFVAYIIDGLILSAVILVLMFPLVPVFFRNGMPVGQPEALPALLVFMGWTWLLGIFGVWIYYALFESSTWQATPGKRVLGLYVCNLQGRRISFARATGRYFAKFLSMVILYIGFIMAGFTEKKQALHDMVTDCLVLRRV